MISSQRVNGHLELETESIYFYPKKIKLYTHKALRNNFQKEVHVNCVKEKNG